MTDWTPLRNELAIWRRENRALPFWWRDDDATEPTPALDRLSSMAQFHDMPLHLAVIPGHASPSLGPALSEGPFRAVVHGWVHKNTAPETEKKSEFSYLEEAAIMNAQRGLNSLRGLFHTNTYAMFVPPWNRISPSVIDGLHGSGFSYLSTFAPRQSRFAAAGVEQVNTHVDPVDWRGTRGLADPEHLIGNLVKHLQDRRAGRADDAEPLGLLTHHLMQDDQTWAFCDALLQELQAVRLERFDIAQAPNGGGRRR